MVASTLPKILAQLRAHEGGYVNHPRDPGGATKWGVTQGTYNTFRKARNLTLQSVKLLTEAEYQEILRRYYWAPARCDELQAGLDYTVLDGGYNSGTKRGVQWLQRVAGVTQDGNFGPLTLAAVKRIKDVPTAIRTYCKYRLSFMQGLKSLWGTFGRGWARRVADVEALSVKIALSAMGQSCPAIAAHADEQADKADAAKVKSQGGAAITAATGTTGTGAASLTVDHTQTISAGHVGVFAVVVVAVILIAIFLWRAHTQKQRAIAYSRMAQEAEDDVG